MTFVIPAPTPASSATASSAASKATSAKPKPQPAASTQEDDFGLSDLGGGLPDLGSDLDDFLNEETHNPFQSPMTMSAPAATPMKSTGSTRGQMNTLANGIKLVFWGTVLAVVASVATSIGARLVPQLALVALGVSLLGNLLSTSGRIVCLGGPKNTGGRGLLIAAVVCDLGAIAITGLLFVGAAHPGMALVSGLLSLSTLILFVLFVKAVATWIRQPQLADDARTIVLLIVLSIVMLVLIFPVALVVPLLTILLVLGFFGTMLAGVIKYLNLLQHTAEAVRR